MTKPGSADRTRHCSVNKTKFRQLCELNATSACKYTKHLAGTARRNQNATDLVNLKTRSSLSARRTLMPYDSCGRTIDHIISKIEPIITCRENAFNHCDTGSRLGRK